jgi:LysM repeat protein
MNKEEGFYMKSMENDREKNKEHQSNNMNEVFFERIDQYLDSLKDEMVLNYKPVVIVENLKKALSAEYIRLPLPNKLENIDTIELYLDSEVIKLDETLLLLDKVNYIYKNTAKDLGIDPSDHPLVIDRIEIGSLLVRLKGKKKAIYATLILICAVISAGKDSSDWWKDLFHKNSTIEECPIEKDVFLVANELNEQYNFEYDCVTNDKTVKYKVITKNELQSNEYTVKKGDTYTKIAQINNIDINLLLKINGLDVDDIIYPGQKLKIVDPHEGGKDE